MFRAIETKYDEHFFRSRTEARWATFFNHLDIPYEYELDGFYLENNLKYLPDFWMPNQKVWIEIKGQHPDTRDFNKVRGLAKGSKCPVFIFWGGIPSSRIRINGSNYACLILPSGKIIQKQQWSGCSSCGSLGITYKGNSNFLQCKTCLYCQFTRNVINRMYYPIVFLGNFFTSNTLEPCKHHGPIMKPGCSTERQKYEPSFLSRAYATARSARFEHGETPKAKR